MCSMCPSTGSGSCSHPRWARGAFHASEHGLAWTRLQLIPMARPSVYIAWPAKIGEDVPGGHPPGQALHGTHRFTGDHGEGGPW